MSFRVIATSRFKRDAKKLSKKYHSLKSDLSFLIDSLEKLPRQGTDLGSNCFKIRLAITSKGKGKSGGARVITHIHVTDSSVFLLSIYDKSKQASLSTKELKELLKQIQE